MVKQLIRHVYWVGVKDGCAEESCLPDGAVDCSLDEDAYLVVDEQTTLINIIAGPRTEQFLQNIREITDPANIRMIVANHMDAVHSDDVSMILQVCPNAKIVASAKAMNGSTVISGIERDTVCVKTGDRMLIGEHELKFVEGPMYGFGDQIFTAIRDLGDA